MDFNTLKLENIQFNTNVKCTNISYLNSRKEQKELIINSPFLNLPFGIEKEYGNYILKFQVSNDNKSFLEFIQNLENIIEKKMGKPVKSQIRYHDIFDPLVITKILNNKNYIITDIQNSKGEYINFFNIKKKMIMKLTLLIDKLWCEEKQIIYKLKVKKIIINSV